eukprot:tig00020951_g16443.t1
MAPGAPASKVVFVPSKSEGYVLADVLTQNEREARVRPRAKDEPERWVPVPELLPSNPEGAAPPDDNTALMHLSGATLLHNLRARYARDQVYTYTVGSLSAPPRLFSLTLSLTRALTRPLVQAYILLAVNPYKPLPVYDDARMARYAGKAIGREEPHVFAVADRAYRLMRAEGADQSIVVR